MITLRFANLDDARFLFDLRNQESNRKMFINSHSVTWEEHLAWLQQRFRNEKFKIFIGLFEGKSIGQFRVSEDGDVSVSLDDKFKGNRLGAPLIAAASSEYRKLFPIDLVAVVKSDNTASIKSFEHAGYIYAETFLKNHQKFDKFIYSRLTKESPNGN